MKFLLKAAIVFAALVAAVVHWNESPERDCETFLRQLRQGQYSEAAEVLEAPSSLQPQPDGGLLVVSHNGESFTVDPQLLPFMPGRAGEPAPPRTWKDRILGRKSFTACAAGFGRGQPRAAPPVTLFFTVERGVIRIEPGHRVIR
jgi:hypothetical protein